MTRRLRPCPLLSPWRPYAAQLSPASRRQAPRAVSLLLLAASLLAAPLAVQAGIRFENCVQGSDGSLSCDTVPTGNTYLDDKDAQYGLLQQASPGWAEFNPYQGYDEDFGGGDD